MENYVLQSGRRGFKSYGRLWEKAYKGMTDEELDMVNQAREKLSLIHIQMCIRDRPMNDIITLVK